MADVLHRTTLEYRKSVHTPDYDPGTWLINPDLSAVSGVPRRYWKVSGTSVVEMDAAEKQAVDADLLSRALAPTSLHYVFESEKANNEWLTWSVGTSDDAPAVVPQPSTLALLAYSSRDAATGTLEVYRSGSLVLSQSLSSATSLLVNRWTNAPAFADGDTLAVYFDTGGAKIKDVVVHIVLGVTAYISYPG